jgi:biopolymer transport protein ExbD
MKPADPSDRPREVAMALSVGGRRAGPLAEINVTPMADIMIVLLIIFMVAIPFIGGPKVPLPTARHADDRDADELKLVVGAGGIVQVGDATFAETAALGRFLEGRAGPDGLPPVLVQGHRDVAYADVSRVLDVCRRAGAAEVRLATAPAPPD